MCVCVCACVCGGWGGGGDVSVCLSLSLSLCLSVCLSAIAKRPYRLETIAGSRRIAKLHGGLSHPGVMIQVGT